MTEDILIRFSVKDDGTPVIERVNEKLRGTKKESQALVPGLENARRSLTSFIGDNAALIGVLVGVGAVLHKVIKDHIEYANSVRALSTLSGESTEVTSRFVQVLDDYKISAGDALLATKALTKEGHTPSIRTLATLSDQYLALNSEQERNEFILKNLGRGGLQWVEVLSKGSKALLEQGAAVDKNLILTQRMVDDARKAEIAVDNWTDAIGALKTQLAVNLLPTLTTVVSHTNAVIEADKRLAEEGLQGTHAWDKRRIELIAVVREEQAAAEAAMLATGSLQENTEAAKLNAEAQRKLAEELSNHILSQISLINSMQQAEDNYTQESKSLTEERIAVLDELAQLRSQGYSEYSGQIQGELSKLDEIQVREAELAEQRDKQTLQFISNILAEQLARDGWTQSEFDAFAEQQEAWGLWSADVVAKSQAAWMEATKITDAINAIPKYTQVQIVTMTNSQTLGGYAYGSQQYNTIARPGRDAGGPGMAGTPYIVNPSAGPEVVIPNQSSSFVPNADKNLIDYKRFGRAVRDALLSAGAN